MVLTPAIKGKLLSGLLVPRLTLFYLVKSGTFRRTLIAPLVRVELAFHRVSPPP